MQQPKLMLPIGHTDNGVVGEFSPDGKKIATASKDGTAKIWDVASGALISDLKGNDHLLFRGSVKFSPDGKRIVTISRNTANVWEVENGRLLLSLNGHTNILTSANFSSDGKKIVTSSSDSSAKIWDAYSGTMIKELKGHQDELRYAQFSPDGKMVCTASYDNTAKLWDIANGKVIAYLPGHDWVDYVEFSKDGKRILTIQGITTNIWDIASGNVITLRHIDGITSAHFSPDGKKIVTGSYDKTAKIWDAFSGVLLFDFKGHKDQITAVAFSPGGDRIVSSSWDNTAKIWDANSGALLANLIGHSGRVKFAQFSPDGKKVLTTSDDLTAKVWNSSTGKPIADLKGHTLFTHSITFSPDGKKFFIVDGNYCVKIWDASKNTLIGKLEGHTSYINDIQFSPDGKKIVTASYDKTAKIWDLTSGFLTASLTGHTDRVNSARFSPDGKRIVTASDDKTVKVWDVMTGKLVANLFGHTYRAIMAECSHDGKKIVSTSLDNSAKVWDATTFEIQLNLKGHTDMINSAHFSVDDKRIVTADFKGIVKVWNSSTGSQLAEMAGQSNEYRANEVSFDKNSIEYVQFIDEDKKLVTISRGNTVRIWNLSSGELLNQIGGKYAIATATYADSDLRKIGVLYRDGSSKIFDIATGQAINLEGNLFRASVIKFNTDGNKILVALDDNSIKTFDATTGRSEYDFFAVDSTDYLIIDMYNHYDGSEGARKLLYFTCGTEMIGLDQVKDQLWVPNLAERINNRETINAKTLNELNICGLTPEVEEATGKADEYYFKIKPRRGGLGETILSVNGNQTKVFQSEQLKKKEEFYELIIKKEDLSSYFIAGTENSVTVKAYTADNAISSRGAKMSEDKTKETATAPNLYAIIVGVSDYKGTGLDLKYAAKDATDISNTVSNAARKLLNSNGAEHVFMYNLTTTNERYQLPEKNSIKKVFEEISKKATANDILLIFFAGHGVMAGEGDKKQFYFLTADASTLASTDAVKEVGISTAELTEWMKPSNIKAQKRIMIFDACNSGQAINDIAGKDLAVRDDSKAQQIKAIDKLNEKSGLFILSASASNQSAYEMGRYAQGLLTYALLKAIKQKPDILNEGKYLDVSKWFNAAKESVADLAKESGARQEPQIVTNTNFNIGLVDAEVMAKIVLPQEKPLFAASNFQNSDESVADDDLELSKLINLQLADISSRGTDSKIVYITATNSPDAYLLSGRYKVKGNDITLTVNIKQNKTIVSKFVQNGTKDTINELAAAVAEKAAGMVK